VPRRTHQPPCGDGPDRREGDAREFEAPIHASASTIKITSPAPICAPRSTCTAVTPTQTTDGITPCADADYSPAPTIETASTTAIATSTILNPRQGGAQVGVTVAGKPFDCDAWTENGPASIATPLLNVDITLPLGIGTIDIAQVLRLND
jgi:hypothetical protein